MQTLYNGSKRTSDGMKMIFEERLTQTEDDDNAELKEIKRVFEREIDQLDEVITTIKDDIESIKRQDKRERDEIKDLQNIKKKA